MGCCGGSCTPEGLATLSAAESVAYAVTVRALGSEPALQQAYVTSCSAAPVPAVFDRMLQEPEGEDGKDEGRNRRRPDEVNP